MRFFILIGGLAAAVGFFLPWFETPVTHRFDQAELVSAWDMWVLARECTEAAAASPSCEGYSERDLYLIVALAGALLGIFVGLIRIPVLGRLVAIAGGVAMLVACGWLGMAALEQNFTLGYGIFTAGVGGILLVFGGLAASAR